MDPLRRVGPSSGLPGRWLLVLATLLTAQARAADWIEIQAADYTLVTNAGERAARRTLREIEALQFAASRLPPQIEFQPAIPVRIFLVMGRSVLREARFSTPAASDASSNPFEAWGVVPQAAEPWQFRREDMLHKLYHLVATTRDLSDRAWWWQEGMALMLASVEARDDDIAIGRIPFPAHARWSDLRRVFGWLTLEEFLTVREADAAPWGVIASRRFRGQAWWTVHYLNIGRPELRQSLARYLELVHHAGASVPAFRTAFNDDADGLQRDVETYAHREPFPVLVIKGEFRPLADQAALREVPSRDASLGLATALLAMEEFDEAEELLENRVRRESQDAWAAALLARVYDRTRRRDQADELIELAEAQAANYAPALRECGNFYLDRALGPGISGRSNPDRMHAWLDRAKTLYRAALVSEPQSPQTTWWLAKAILADPAPGEPSQVLPGLRSIAATMPPQPRLDGLIADLLGLQGQLPAARSYAQQALLHARTREERQRAADRLARIEHALATTTP